MALHTTLSAAAFSPGTAADSSAFPGLVVDTAIPVDTATDTSAPVDSTSPVSDPVAGGSSLNSIAPASGIPSPRGAPSMSDSRSSPGAATPTTRSGELASR
jgi:hypothetical protein